MLLIQNNLSPTLSSGANICGTRTIATKIESTVTIRVLPLVRRLALRTLQGYLKKASQGKYKEALAIIKKENPFPAVCGRICNRRCEDACTRGTIDRAVSIDAVKKFIAEQDLHAEHRYVPDIVVASNMGRWKEKIAIIGGGPAGLSCAYYLAQMGYYPTVFEKNEKPGGMLT